MNQENHPPLLVLSGPTASGKTALSLEIARRMDVEVVSADSRQVYKFMDIGTAKPSHDQQRLVKHHMIDVVMPHESYSAGRYAVEANQIIADVYSRRHVPLVVGGSGLYLRALTQGLFDAPKIPDHIRSGLRKDLELQGAGALHLRLQMVDAESAAKINPSDWKKICRALEVWQATGIRISNLQKIKKARPCWSFYHIHINPPRKILYERIDARVLEMVRQGLFDEVKGLVAQGHDTGLNALKTVGYQESIAHLKGLLDRNAAIELIQRNTRRYAKRQVTWFRKTDVDVRFNQETVSAEQVLLAWQQKCAE